MFKAIGFSDSDLNKPLIGVANTWIETMPCNFHLRRLSAKVKDGIRAAGGTPMEFNTIAISDGETMGTEGMKASLVSREVIADSMAAHFMFNLIQIVGRPETGNKLDLIRALGPSGNRQAVAAQLAQQASPTSHDVAELMRERMPSSSGED